MPGKEADLRLDGEGRRLLAWQERGDGRVIKASRALGGAGGGAGGGGRRGGGGGGGGGGGRGTAWGVWGGGGSFLEDDLLEGLQEETLP